MQHGSGFLLSAHHQERRDHVVGGPQDGDDEGGFERGAGGQVHQAVDDGGRQQHQAQQRHPQVAHIARRHHAAALRGPGQFGALFR